jgi:hypothetical protein
MGHVMILAGLVMTLGPLVAPSLYDAAAAPITITFGLDFLLLGMLLRKVLPLVGSDRPRAA